MAPCHITCVHIAQSTAHSTCYRTFMRLPLIEQARSRSNSCGTILKLPRTFNKLPHILHIQQAPYIPGMGSMSLTVDLPTIGWPVASLIHRRGPS